MAQIRKICSGPNAMQNRLPKMCSFFYCCDFLGSSSTLFSPADKTCNLRLSACKITPTIYIFQSLSSLAFVFISFIYM